jgi:glycosyltransferase involved in cell wall biosynthesis
MQQLRIAVVSETWPPEVNGVAITLERLVDALHARGHEIELVRPRQQGGAAEPAPRRPRFDELLLPGLALPRYPGLRMGLPCRRALLQRWSLQRPDVVHIATEGPLGWSALRAASQLGLPVCSDFRTNFQAYSGHYGLGWLRRPITAYLRRFHNLGQCTTVPTEALQRELARAGFKRLAVVGRGVDTRLFSPRRRSAALRHGWGVQEHDLVVACVGRLAAEKNLELMSAAFAAIRRHKPRARLLLVGDGPLRPQLAQQWPDALFAGQRSAEDLAAHYASADMLLFPSLTETFGNVTTEAMASALPVVAFDHAAAGQLIRNGHDGLLAPRGDARSFIRQAVALAGDREWRACVGERARERVIGLGWPAVAARLEALLRGTINQQAGPQKGPPAPRPVTHLTPAGPL